MMRMESPPSLTFGTLVRRYRVAAGLTQEELAERAGISRRGIGDLERGVAHRPHADTVALLAAALGLPPHEQRLFAQTARRPDTPASVLPPSGGSAPPFVGRARELALLERHLAGEGPPVLLLAGEPGIGKTRLLHAALPRAVALGVPVLQGGCRQRGGQEPYAPLLDAVQRHIRTQTPARLRVEFQGCAWLVRLLPELAAAPMPPLPAWTLTPAQEHRLMVDALLRFLGNVAGPGGLVLLLDDLQWAGPDALDLLAVLARAASVTPAAGALPLRVVGAYRDTEARAGDPLAALLADLAHAGLAVRRLLAPLAPDEAAHLLEELLPVEDRPVVPRERLLQRTGGLPFFLVSCAQALRQQGLGQGQGAGVQDAQDTVPWDVEQSIRQRLVALPAEARLAVDVAAVAGRSVSRPLLSHATGWPENAMAAALDAACQARLLEEQGETDYRFTHDLIREAVEADLSAARRALLHRQVADALAQQPGPVAIDRVAYHYARSDAREQALVALEQAGDQAQERYAAVAAADLYREVLRRLHEVDRPHDAVRVQEKLGAALEVASAFDAGLEVLDHVAMAYEAVGDQEGLRRTLARIGRLHAARDTPEDGLARLLPAAEALRGQDPSAGLAALYAALAWLFVASGRYRESVATAEQAAEVARAVGDDRILADVEARRGTGLITLGQVEEGRRALERALPLAEAVGDLNAVGRIYNNLAVIARKEGEFARGTQWRERALAVTTQIREVVGQRWAMAGLGELLFLRGDWDAAQAQLERAVGVMDAAGWSLMAIVPLVTLIELHRARGEDQQATHYLNVALAHTGPANPDRQWFLAQRDLLAGQPAAAAQRLIPVLYDPNLAISERVPLVVLLAWARLEHGDLSQVGDLAAQALAWVRAQGDHVGLVDVAWVYALAEIRQGQVAQAGQVLDEALALAVGMPYPHAHARLLFAYGLLHAHKGELAPARNDLAGALALFERLAARRDAERVRHYLDLVS